MTDRSERAVAVRKLVQEARHGLLATAGLEPAGYPYGSLVMLTATGDGEPAFLISPLAQHTKNLVADPRASLLVTADRARDPMEAPRATVLGSARLLEGSAEAAAKARLLERTPGASVYLDLGFQLWALTPVEARFIGGFGAAAWVDGSELLGA